MSLVWECFEFYGIAPRFRKKHLPKGYATVAHDVDLTHGTLKSFLQPRFIKRAPEDSVKLHAWGCDLMTWDKCVDVAEWIPDCPRLFITGNADYPQTITKEADGSYTYRRLGVLQPKPAPTATADNVDKDTSRSTAYLITFVNSFGEESAPSHPSNDVVIEDGQEVKINFRYNPPLEYDIKKLRIYRRETGFRTGQEKEQALDTYWFFLTELDISEREFVDTVPITQLGWAFEGINNREPPERLANITAITDTAILAGSVYNKVLFSRNLQPHNWELSQELTLDDNVVAMGSVGANLYVATDGYPYRIQGDIGCDDKACRTVYKYKQAFPMINCHTGHGLVETPFGVIYAAPDGLVLLSGDRATVITTEVLSQDDWRKLAPHTARLAYYKGALFCVTDKISFILWLDADTYADTKHKKMVTISDEPIDLVTTRQGELILLQKNGYLEQWNAGNMLRPYRWVSATLDAGYLFDFTRIRALVRDGRATVHKLSNRYDIERTFPTGDETIPYGHHGRVREMFFEIDGIGELTELAAGFAEVDIGGLEHG